MNVLKRTCTKSPKDILCKVHNRNRCLTQAGFGTLEVVIILAVLLTVAMLFRTTLKDYAGRLMAATFKDSILTEIDAERD